MSLLHRTHDDLPELTPAQLAELDALDAALAGEQIDDPELASLVRDIRAAAPQLAPEAAQRLNDRVGAARRERRLRIPLHGAPAAAASLLLVVAVAGGGYLVAGPGRDGGETGVLTSQESGPFSAEPSEPPVAAVADSAAAGSNGESAASAEASPSGKAVSPQGEARTPTAGDTGAARTTGRAVERTVDLDVRVKTGELQGAAAKVARITREASGYVSTSDLSLGEHGAGSAEFTLRVASAQLDRAIDRLSGLGTVTAQQESSRDITSALDSAKARLADATRERAAILRALGKATSAGEIAALRARLAENRRLRARLDAQVQQVQRRADLTTIQLTLTAPAQGDPTADDGSWSLGDAASDAWSVLRSILGALLVGAAVALPFALLAVLGWAVWGARRRAARERALD